MVSNPFDQFERIYCISLEHRKDRRNHIVNEFARVGIRDYRWIDAVDKDSDEVMQQFRLGKVSQYPPCFRCGRDTCNCDNKKIFPAQVANWLSHMTVWKSVSGFGLSMICEDDVRFTDRVREAMAYVAVAEKLTSELRWERPVLVRLGWQLMPEHDSPEDFKLTEEIRMANPCYAINRPFAQMLIDQFDGFSTTSDVYIHSKVGPLVSHFTLHPPAAYELSWSTGELKSDIRPKQRHIERLLAQLESRGHSDSRYQELLEAIERERERMRQFELFNSDGAGFDKERFPLI